MPTPHPLAALLAGYSYWLAPVGRSTMTGGNQYRLTLRAPSDRGNAGAETSFPFHGSPNDRERGATPDPLDAIGCLLSDASFAEQWEGMSEDDAADDYAREMGADGPPSEAYRFVCGSRAARAELVRVLGEDLYRAALDAAADL